MDPIESLSTLFVRFPGIGPRQAGRFVQFLLRSSPSYRRELMQALQELGHTVHQCPECMRYFAGENPGGACSLCAGKRDRMLTVVATDTDLLALERSGMYRGYYFVLGGTISLASDKAAHLRLDALKQRVQRQRGAGLEEIILAFPANPEGDATAVRVHEELKEEFGDSIRITELGRGLSTGSELEYADPETLKNAFRNRK